MKPLFLLGTVVILLVITAISLSFLGYPKTIESENTITLTAQDNKLQLYGNKIKTSRQQHLLAESTTNTLQLTLTLKASSDLYIANNNFWLQCFTIKLELVNCSDNSRVADITPENSLSFNRKISRLTKTPLDLTLTALSKEIEYRPEFFGIDKNVERMALVFGYTSYSRTDLNLTTQADLTLPLPFP